MIRGQHTQYIIFVAKCVLLYCLAIKRTRFLNRKVRAEVVNGTYKDGSDCNQKRLNTDNIC